MSTSGGNNPGAQPPAPATQKRNFSIDELKAINEALLANPATNNKKLVARVMDVLNDPGVTPPPINRS